MTRPQPVDDLSPGRRLAVASYAAPSEGKIYGTIEIDATEALRYLERRQKEGVRLSMIHLVVRGAALALRDSVPELNRMIRRGRLYKRPTIDIFVQVAIKRGRDISGLKISRADEKSPEEISREIKKVGVRVRKGEEGVARTQKMLEVVPTPLLRPFLQLLRFLLMDLGLNLSPLGLAEDPFGSVMVTDLSPYGLGVGYPALLPLSSASCIIAIGEITERPVVRDGKVVIRPILPLSATFDHRIANAYHAGALVNAARKLLENPELLT